MHGGGAARRFGVEQRAKLAAKAAPAPHVMYMTATPIPRTLALVEHGDLALCTIDDLPPGRSRVATRALTDSPAARALVREPPLLSSRFPVPRSVNPSFSHGSPRPGP